MSTQRLAVALAALLLAAATIAPLAHAQGPQTAPAPTLFGHGPEIYVSPTWGTVGRTVTVVGLGYQPGRSVAITVMPYDPWAGGPVSTCLSQVRARTTVRDDGTMRAAFVLPSSYAALLHGRSMFTLDVRVWYGHGCAGLPTGSHAPFILFGAAFAPGTWWGR
jgi:hypothetical protein